MSAVARSTAGREFNEEALKRGATSVRPGNVVLLGFGIAGGYNLPVVGPLVSLGAFLFGAGCGGRW